MVSKAFSSALFPLLLVLCLLNPSEAHVEFGFYNVTCPNAETMVRDEVSKILTKQPDLAGALVRLHFVDCFVGGCEASILLNSTANKPAEKDAPLNKGIRGFDVIDSIKAKLEQACPGIVSCADIITMAARDSVYLSHGSFYTILTGRRDGNGSVASDVAKYIPPPTATIDDLKAFFAKNNLTVKDLVVLSGAHTLGKAHCYSFSNRLYNFTGNGGSDPSLDANYTIALQNQCKPNDMTTLVDMDPDNATMFDLDYYKLVSNMKGLFSSDVALLSDVDAKAYVVRQANATTTDEFFNDFATSMVTMGRLGVLTHQQGEIRKICSVVNPPMQPPLPSPSAPPKSGSAKSINVFVGFLLGFPLLCFLIL